ncbi:uncharacterized protein SPPG_04451 [Spizellomyces punctatus DAOM BR117]|uniref:Uncharacterized protein n=1 Tax=Spizellomyces punctatus (strain DAOM BR117) TaxID=645134 RepID=A0A0L0HH53_SPIPD|nr:uncharacterized protein SPPG_04451 [Spizellomyces punctatus DAOM BR117]KND00109.1 hypothetical protein SPPG_04451 [Spizellomyces punctatus DAOM BR117]|eukprot:XP_016608148.1 hypothetical protein SPPG_04451 [Spizellomyces punctatus DAOM BR117]
MLTSSNQQEFPRQQPKCVPLPPGTRLKVEQAQVYNLRGLGHLYAEGGGNRVSDASSAIADFTRAIFLNPDEPSYYWHRAEAYLAIVDFESAIANLKQHALIVNELRADALRVGGWVPPSAERKPEQSTVGGSIYVSKKRLGLVAYTWGQCLLDQRRFKEAMRMFQLAGSLEFQISSVLLRCVFVHIGLGEFDDALETLYKLTKLDASNIELYILRAKIYKHLGNVDFANIDLQAADEIDRDHPELPELREYAMTTAVGLKNKASERILAGEPTVAIHYLNTVIELDKADWSSYFKRGILLAEIGQYDGAIQDLQKVLEISDRDTTRDPEVKERIASVYNKAGIQAYQEGDLVRALSEFSIGLDHHNSDPVLWKNRADCYLATGNISKSLEDLMKAVEIDPQDVACRQRCGLLWSAVADKIFSTGDWAQSARMWTAAIQYDPACAELFFKRARAYHLSQKIDEAREDLEEALRLDPSSIEISALLSQLTVGPPLDNLGPFPPQRTRRAQVPYANQPAKEPGLIGKSIMAPVQQPPPTAAPNMLPHIRIPDLLVSISSLVTNSTGNLSFGEGSTGKKKLDAKKVVAESQSHILSLPPVSLPKLSVEEGGPTGSTDRKAFAPSRDLTHGAKASPFPLSNKDVQSAGTIDKVDKTTNKSITSQKPSLHHISLQLDLQ